MSWIDQYRSKLKTAREAVACVESGMRVYIHPGCAEPEALVEALMVRAPFVKDVEVMHLLTHGTSPYCAPEMAEHFRHNALFVGGNVREAVNDGRADYTPIFLSEVEALFESGEMPIDVAFIQVSPPDPHGYCSFGVGVECTLTAAKYAHHVVAQVNAQMPRTYGDSFIHVSDIDSIVELSRPLCELKTQPSSELFRRDRGACSLADRRRLCPTMWDRRYSGRSAAQPDGPQRPWRPHRADLRQCNTADRGRRHQLASARTSSRARSFWALCWAPGSCSTSSTKIPSSNFIPRPTPTIHSALRRTTAWWPSTRPSRST